jgi:hypothetical protein
MKKKTKKGKRKKRVVSCLTITKERYCFEEGKNKRTGRTTVVQ